MSTWERNPEHHPEVSPTEGYAERDDYYHGDVPSPDQGEGAFQEVKSGEGEYFFPEGSGAPGAPVEVGGTVQTAEAAKGNDDGDGYDSLTRAEMLEALKDAGIEHDVPGNAKRDDVLAEYSRHFEAPVVE